MKTVKPNLKKMFNFHTIILVLLVIVVSTLNTHNAEGKFQTLHKHHHHKHNYKHENVLGDSDDESNEDSDKQHELYSQHGHHNQHHHSHHHHHHQQQQQLQQHLYATTPSLEFTTSSSLPSVSPGQVDGDNEFLIKPQQQQQELPLTNKDEIFYKTKELQSSSSTTSKPTLSIHLMKLHNRNPKSSNSNSSSKHSGTSTNSQREHTHLGHYNRLIPTPLTTPEGKSGIDNNRSQNTATMYSAVAQENENSKWKLAAKDEDTKNINEQAAVVHEKLQSHNEQKPEFHNDRRRPQHNYDDYYSDAEDGDDDDDDENDVDDEYSEDEGDNDGISYDDDNNLSDRSYARITRSKLDDDYIDDEPYRNELSMQRDAAPGVLTEQKYMDVGNEKAVQQARERYMQEQKRPRTPHELATEHWHRMIQATKCRKPLPRVIPVSNNTSKRYEPYATILHRCGDDTGCCGSTASVCTVKRHEIVMVYVFSYDFNYRKEIEALPMQNHTECHCVNRGSLLHDYMPRDKRSGGSGSYLHHFQRQQKKQQEQQQQYRQSQPQQPLQYHHHQQQLQNMLDCHCPRHFNVFEEDVERHVHLPKPHSVFIRKCRCDCLVNSQTCLRFKHGEEGFSLEDRKCILDRNCKPPVCSNGEYNSRVGRCPSYRSHLLQMT